MNDNNKFNSRMNPKSIYFRGLIGASHAQYKMKGKQMTINEDRTGTYKDEIKSTKHQNKKKKPNKISWSE